MDEITTVLAATDFSECAQTALGTAAETASLFEARLVVAHVLQNLDHSYSLLIDDIAQGTTVEEEEEQEAESSLGQAIDELRISRSQTDSVVTRGSPVETLIRIGLREHADLLVAGLMGSACGGDTLVLGSVVDRLLRCGLFDLLLVRRDETPGFQRIAVAADFSESADLAVRRAIDLAKRSGLDEITLIHAFEVPHGYFKLGIGEDEAERRVRKNIQEELDDLCARVPECSAISVESTFVKGHAPEAVREACKDRGVDLLVLGAAGRTAAAAALIGNVALKIVRDAPCSVWVSRPAGQTLTVVDALHRLMGLAE